MTTDYKQYREQVKRYSDGAIRDLINGKKRNLENAEIELGALQEEQAARERAKNALSTADVDGAVRLLGFALFNHAKGNSEATETLMRKAYKALTGREWDE